MAFNEQSGLEFWQGQPMTPCQTIELAGVNVVVKRDDKNHEFVQGNKLRKLKYNLIEAQRQGVETLITFGGAYSNHLLATAFAAQACGLSSLGVVRGHELEKNQAIWSETLFQCKQLGMQLVFVSRSDYRLKTKSQVFQGLVKNTPNSYVLPEGGSNQLALQGVAEIVAELQQQVEETPTHLICPVGTGGTLAGLVYGVAQKKWMCKVIGVAVLKGLHSIKDDINQWLTTLDTEKNYDVLDGFHAGGYAKNTKELSRFCVTFEQHHQIQLDKIYNSKSFFALAQLIKSRQITAKDRPLIIHTGGIQGGVNK